MEIGETSEPSDNEKNIYFMLVFPKDQDVDFNKMEFKSKPEMKPQIIFDKKIEKDNETYIDHKIFKVKTKKSANQKNKGDKVKKTHHEIIYEIGEDEYVISFDTKENSFVYDLDLKKGNKYLKTIVPINIDQNIIQIHNKLEIFVEALGKDKNQIYKLYEETIDLYKIKAKFNLLISLFLQVYDNKEIENSKNLCSKLISIFKEINGTGNTDRDKNLDLYLDNFQQIFLNADNIINYYEYDAINFYGIILCYLNYYEEETNFSSDLKKLYERENLLYEILVIYYSHFINPINQDVNFYNKFLGYIIDKIKKKNFQ